MKLNSSINSIHCLQDDALQNAADYFRFTNESMCTLCHNLAGSLKILNIDQSNKSVYQGNDPGSIENYLIDLEAHNRRQPIKHQCFVYRDKQSTFPGFQHNDRKDFQRSKF